MIKAWSYSRLRDYRKCPLYAKLRHVLRLKEPSNTAMERGTKIHELASKYITLDIPKMPKELAAQKKLFKDLRKRYSLAAVQGTEQQWAFTKKWDCAEWFGQDAWVRVVADLFFISKDGDAFIYDFKTGRLGVYDAAYEEQVSLYACAIMHKFQDVVTVNVGVIFVDHDVETRMTAFQNDAATRKSLKDYWAKETKALLADRNFVARPGDYCRWCHFRKANGGPCVY